MIECVLKLRQYQGHMCGRESSATRSYTCARVQIHWDIHGHVVIQTRTNVPKEHLSADTYRGTHAHKTLAVFHRRHAISLLDWHRARFVDVNGIGAEAEDAVLDATPPRAVDIPEVLAMHVKIVGSEPPPTRLPPTHTHGPSGCASTRNYYAPTNGHPELHGLRFPDTHP